MIRLCCEALVCRKVGAAGPCGYLFPRPSCGGSRRAAGRGTGSRSSHFLCTPQSTPAKQQIDTTFQFGVLSTSDYFCVWPKFLSIRFQEALFTFNTRSLKPTWKSLDSLAFDETRPKYPTLEAIMRDLLPTGQTTISQSESSSAGTSTNHSDSMS